MNEVNEKMISQFLDLMHKVHGLELQVQNIAKDHAEMMTKTTKMLQGFQDSLTEALNNQNKLVKETNNNLATQVNNALGKVADVATSCTQTYLAHNAPTVDYDYLKEQQIDMLKKINNIFKSLSLITRSFKEISTLTEKEEKISIQENPLLLKKIEEDLDDKFTYFRVRTVNALRAEKILTLGDLIKYTPKDLRKIPNFGMKSLRDVREVFEKIGLSLRVS